METHIHTRGYRPTGSVGETIHIGRDVVLTLGGRGLLYLSLSNFFGRITIECF